MTSTVKQMVLNEHADKFESSDTGPKAVTTKDRRARRERRQRKDRRAEMRFDLHRPQRRANDDRRSEGE